MNPLNLRQSTSGSKSILQNLAVLFCILFGLALIVQTQAAADGGWYWYAVLYRSGQHLYSDLHLALQPLFVLETSAFLSVLGKGWIAMKIPAVIHMIAYVFGFYILVRASNRSDAEKAFILVCAFFASISFEAYRFDDYHVLSDCFELYSLIVLLNLQKTIDLRRVFALTALLGVFCGLAITNRLNDGGGLFVGVALGIFALIPSRKLVAVLFFCLATALTIVLVVRLTGDSLHDYAMYSIFKAAGSKGGTGNVLAYPLELPIRSIQWLREDALNPITVYSVFAVVLWTFTVAPFTRKRGQWEQLVLAVLGMGLVLFFLHRLYDICRNALYGMVLTASLAGIVAILAYPLALWVLARFVWWALHVGRTDTWDHREILFLIPIGQLASGSMSSGGSHIGLYGPMTILVVLLCITSPIHLTKNWQRDCLFAFSVLVLLATFNLRVRRPFSWHTYTEEPLFVGRVWYAHPVYGPMMIDRDLLQLIQPVCQTIQQDDPHNELLALPWPYANYFCNIPPWHGYVQTFFDTTSKQTIDSLMAELEHSPPQWIFYERQLNTLKLHEHVYNQDKPLEQRYLDQLIQQKIAEGAWHVVYTSDYGNHDPWDNHWFLIRTDASVSR